MEERDIINEDTEYIIGDGIITYYRYGFYVNYKIIESNELKRKTEYDTE
jgi:hypothetical protein